MGLGALPSRRALGRLLSLHHPTALPPDAPVPLAPLVMPMERAMSPGTLLLGPRALCLARAGPGDVGASGCSPPGAGRRGEEQTSALCLAVLSDLRRGRDLEDRALQQRQR